jgi:hypothetical protein
LHRCARKRANDPALAVAGSTPRLGGSLDRGCEPQQVDNDDSAAASTPARSQSNRTVEGGLLSPSRNLQT